MSGLVYGIEDRPASVWETLLYGWQHTLVDISPFVLPLAIATAVGMDDAAGAAFINFGLVAMGVATLIQTTIGNRLPIVQGPSATLIGTMAPVGAQLGAGAMWGGIFVGGLVEAAVGASRGLGRLRRFFPAHVAGVVVLTIGLSLGHLAVRLSVGSGTAAEVLFAAAVIVLVPTLRLGFPDVAGGLVARGAIFISIWVVGIGIAAPLGQVDWALVASKPWLQLPRPFPYGGPGFGWELSAVAVLAALAGYAGSMVESIGDYVATCSVSDVELEQRHIDRGIAAEGFGSALAACFGGLPCTSYTQNVGIIATTGVASRAVVRVAGMVLLAYGLSPKFGALLVAMPRPVLGGVFVIVCGMIALSGIRLLARAERSTGNDLVVGLTLIVALSLPPYVQTVLGAAWLDALGPAAQLLLTSPIVLAVFGAVALNAMLSLSRRG